MDRIENILDTGGRYLSAEDRQFVSTLLNELEQFQYQAPKDRALMFHPLGGFQRYLIHKVAEVFPKLTSFSIGDESNRRTVVCFKSKKKDQQQGFQAGSGARTLPNPKNDYGPSPQHSRPGSRGTMPPGGVGGARSRDSSRSRKKQEPPAEHRPGKADSMSHLPKPLRNKKTSTRREQMKRSRSLQSSPVHMEEPDYYLTDQDEKRGRRKRENDPAKRAPRSSSLKPLNRRRDRAEPFEDEYRSKKKPAIPHNASDVSLVRRTQGLHMEGHVMNGDVEDPYSQGDVDPSERVDHEAVRKHRHNRSTKKSKKPAPVVASEESDTPSDATCSSDDEQLQMSKRVNGHRHDTEEEEEEEASDGDLSESRVHSSDEDSSEEEDDSPALDSDERPPSYNSVKRVASMKKAERNLDRIKRVDSQRSSGKSDHEQTGRDSSSSAGSSKRKPKPKGKSPHSLAAVSGGKPINKNRSSTMPRSSNKEPQAVKPRSSSTKRAQTLKHANKPPTKEKTPVEKPKVEVKKEPLQRSTSTGSKKTKSSRKIKAEKVVPPPDANGDINVSTEDLLQGSSSTLYMNLPESKPKSETKSTGSKKEKKRPTKSQSTSSSPARKSLSSLRCDGAAQTDVTGTLSRRKEKPSPTESSPTVTAAATTVTTTTQSQPETPLNTAWNSKNPGDFLASMVQYFGMNQQPGMQSQPPLPNINPNAFQQFLQQQNMPPNPMPSFPPLPPHLAHQLYLSWLGAYYAGAAGTWPPPAPPAFLLPQMAQGAPSNQQTPFEMPNYLNPSNFGQFARPPMSDNHRQRQDSREDDSQFYDPYYSSPGQEDFRNREPYADDVENPGVGSEAKYSFPAYLGPDNASNVSLVGSVDGTSKRQNFEDDYSYSSRPVSHSSKRSHQKASRQECVENGHCSSSIAFSDAETDASSVVSSTAKGEVAVATNTKGGNLMVYVHSQPNSRTSSTAGTHESIESLNTSDNVQSLSSTPRTSDHSGHSSQSERKKSPRQQQPKQQQPPPKGKSTKSAPASKNARGSRKTVPGEGVKSEARIFTNSAPLATNINNNHSLPPLSDEAEVAGLQSHADVVLLEHKPPNHNLAGAAKATAAAHHSTPIGGSRAPALASPYSSRLDNDPSLDTSAALKTDIADASHEEMILSLRRAPLATIEDDVDGSMSASHASSCSSLHSAHVPPPVEQEETPTRYPTPPPPITEEAPPQPHEAPSSSPVSSESETLNDHKSIPTFSSTSDTAQDRLAGEEEDATEVMSVSSTQPGSSDKEETPDHVEVEVEIKTKDQVGDWPPPPTYESQSSSDEVEHLKIEEPPANEHVKITSSSNSSKTSSSDDESDASEHSLPVSVEEKSHTPGVDVPMIDDNDDDDDEAASKHSSTTSSDSEAYEDEPVEPRSSTAAEKATDAAASDPNLSDSSTPTEDRDLKPASENSYDADQSHLDESALAKSTPDDPSAAANLITQLDGDVVVQAPELDYNSWRPNQDRYKSAKYLRYVEAHGFTAGISDLALTKYLGKYRGLRFSRVDGSHALLVLPTPELAEELLADDFEAFQCRPLFDATDATQQKADKKIENDEFEEARSKRPQTSSAVAKRLIAGALGSSKFAPQPSDDARRLAKEHRQSRKSTSKVN